MTDQLFKFLWPVAEDGYRWQDSRLRRNPHAGTAWYEPMAETGLFKTFAELQPTKAGIEQFAAQYGLLTASELIGETLAIWQYHIREVAQAVRLWQMVRARDVRGLSQFIRWKRGGVDYNVGEHTSRWIAQEGDNLITTFEQGDLVRPAWFQLQYLVNNRLKAKVSAKLLWNTSHNRLSLYHAPTDLISAIWLQLARAIDGDRTYQQCLECRNWFEVASPDGSRADKKFCGSACRARAWRKGKDTK